MFLQMFEDESYEVVKLRKELLDRCFKNPLGAFHRNMGLSWYSAIRQELGANFVQVIQELDSFLKEERKAFLVFPKPELVWRFTQDFDLEDTKVVAVFFVKVVLENNNNRLKIHFSTFTRYSIFVLGM